MSEFLESHHPCIHDAPKAPLSERFEHGVRRLIDKLRDVGGVMIRGVQEAPSESIPEALVQVQADIVIAEATDIARQAA